MRGNYLRTRQYDKRVHILHKSQLVDSPPCKVFLGLQVGHGVSLTIYTSRQTHGLYGSMLKSTSWAIDTVHGQIPDRSPYIEAVSFTQISCASVTDWMLIP